MAGLSVQVDLKNTEEFQHLFAEVNKLAVFLEENHPGECSPEETYIDVAIRLINSNLEDINIVDTDNKLIASVGKSEVILKDGYQISKEDVIDIN